MTPQEKAALQANAQIGISTKDQNTASGQADFAKIAKQYKVQNLTPPPPQPQGFDLGASLGNAASNALGAVGNVANNAVKFGGDVLNNVGNVAQAVNPMSGEDLGKRASRLGETAMNAGKTAIQPMIGVGQDIAGGLGDVYQGLTGQGDLGSKVGQAMTGLGKLGQIGSMGLAAPGMKSLANAGLPDTTQAAGKFYGDIGHAAGKGVQDTGTGVLNIGTGIGQLTQGKTGEGIDNILRKGLFQAASGATNAVYSPIAGAMGTLPEFAKQGLGQVAKGGEDLINNAMSSAGLDPNSIAGQNVKAGLQALFDVGSLGAGKVVGGALKSGKLGSQAAKAAEATAAFSGKAGEAFDSLIKNAVQKVGKTAGTIAGKGLDTASNALWTTPSEVMKKIHANGDEFLRVIDDPLTAQHEAFSRLGSSIDDAISKTQASGKGYDPFRKSGQTAILPKEPVMESFAKVGLEFKNGKLSPINGDIANTILTPEEISHLNKNLVPALPVGKTITADQFLNLRTKLSNMAKFDMGATGRTDAVRNLVRDVRAVTNESAKNVFTGLKELDSKFSQAKGNLKQMQALFMKKDPVTKQFVIKPNIQPETLSNLLSPRNRGQLAKLESTAPGITKQLEVLDLVKKIEGASNLTTGASLRRIAGSMSGGGIGGPIGSIAGFFLTDPKMAAKMIARLGKATKGSTLGKAAENVQKATRSKPKIKKGIDTFADAMNNQQQQTTTNKGELAQAVKANNTYQGTGMGSVRRPADYGVRSHELNLETIENSRGNITDKAKDVLKTIQGNPDANVLVYRGAPKGAGINDGDWITLDPDIAKSFTRTKMGTPLTGYEVQSMKVKARDIAPQKVAGRDAIYDLSYLPNKR